MWLHRISFADGPYRAAAQEQPIACVLENIKHKLLLITAFEFCLHLVIEPHC